MPEKRLKYWETDRIFKCPLVGMCLTFPEQIKLLKRTDFSVKKSSPFEIHEALVSCSSNEKHVSMRIDGLLHRKYGKEAKPLLELPHGEFVSQFKKAFKSGDSGVFLWAAAISPDLSDALKREIFGEFHMAMHFNTEQGAVLEKKLAFQQKEIEGLREQHGRPEPLRFELSRVRPLQQARLDRRRNNELSAVESRVQETGDRRRDRKRNEGLINCRSRLEIRNPVGEEIRAIVDRRNSENIKMTERKAFPDKIETSEPSLVVTAFYFFV